MKNSAVAAVGLLLVSYTYASPLSFKPYTITAANVTETVTLPVQPIPTSGWTTTTYTVPGATVTEPIPIAPGAPTAAQPAQQAISTSASQAAPGPISYGPYTITEADHTETVTLPIQPIPTSGWTTTTYTVPGATITEPIPIQPIPTSGWTTTVFTVPGATITEPIPIAPSAPSPAQQNVSSSSNPSPGISTLPVSTVTVGPSPASSSPSSPSPATSTAPFTNNGACALPTPAFGLIAGAIGMMALL